MSVTGEQQSAVGVRIGGRKVLMEKVDGARFSQKDVL